ncbi:MAG: hypothetical protein WCO40_04190 [Thermoleophilia bacterium]
MQSSTLNKITIGTLGLLLTGSIGYGVHQSDQVNSWQKEAAGWQAVAAQTNNVSLKVNAQNKQLVRKFNKLASGTATSAAPITVSAAAVAQPTPVAQAAPAAAPASKAS